MNHGVIEQDGTPVQVVEQPATPFVTDFLGTVNIFHGRVDESGESGIHVRLAPGQVQRLGLTPGSGVFLKPGKARVADAPPD
jgi:sulfate/thiosulfate transport system ATP-binding protein